MSLLVNFGLQILFACALFLSVFGRILLDFLKNYWQSDNPIVVYLQDLTATLAIITFCYLVMVYYLLPNVKIPRIPYVLPGSIFVLLTLVLILNIFSASVNHYINNLVEVRFVSFIIFVVTMFWFILLAKILIIGAVINASVQSLKDLNFRKD